MTNPIGTRLCRSALIACSLFLFGFNCSANSGKRSDAELHHHEDTFVFAGKCANGEPYRLFYIKKVSPAYRNHTMTSRGQRVKERFKRIQHPK